MFSWINFLSYAVVTAITPGPNNISSMSNGGRLGLKKSFPYNLGIWLGFSVVMIGCAAGCSLLSELIPQIQKPMMVAGAAYLLWMAWKTFRASDVIEDKHSESSFLAGLMLQFVNVKIYIYGIVSMEVYVLPYFEGQWGVLIGFALLLAFMGFVCNICWALFGTMMRTLFSKYAKATNTVMALLLVWCAAALFI